MDSAAISKISSQMLGGIELKHEDIIGLFDTSVSNAFLGNYGGLLFLKDKVYVKCKKNDPVQCIAFQEITDVTTPTSSSITIHTLNGQTTTLNGILSYGSEDVRKTFFDILAVVKSNSAEHTHVDEQELIRFKRKLLKSHINLFTWGTQSQRFHENIKNILGLPQFSKVVPECVVACITDQYSKGKHYGVFTEKHFYGTDIEGTYITCEISDIIDVCINKPRCLITKKDCTSFVLPESVGKHFLGIAIINNLHDTDDTPYRKYIIEKQKYIFGEVMDFRVSEKNEKRLNCELGDDISKEIIYHCHLTKLTLTSATFTIKIKKERDIDNAYSKEEWVQSVENFANNHMVQTVYSDCICDSLGIHYKPDQLEFVLQIKEDSTFTKVVKTASWGTVGVISNAVRIAAGAAENEQLESFVGDLQDKSFNRINDIWTPDEKKNDDYFEAQMERNAELADSAVRASQKLRERSHNHTKSNHSDD